MQWLWITKMQWEICSVLSGRDSHLAVLLIVCITGMQIISEAISTVPNTAKKRVSKAKLLKIPRVTKFYLYSSL